MRWGFGLVAASGCGGLADGFEADLTRTGGCGDLYAFAVDDADATLLEVTLDGPGAAAGGVEATTTFSLPDRAAVVDVERGAKISDAACDDLIENGGPRVRSTWSGVSGDVTVTVHADDRADVSLTDVVLESAGGDPVTVPQFDWTDLPVGLFPG